MKAVILAGLASLCAPLYAQVNATNLGGGSMPGATWSFAYNGLFPGGYYHLLGVSRSWQQAGWVVYPAGMCGAAQSGPAETLCLMFYGNPSPPVPLASGCAWWHAPIGALGYMRPVTLAMATCSGGWTWGLFNEIHYPPAISGYTIHLQSASMVGNVQAITPPPTSGPLQQVTANNLSTPYTCEVVPGLNLVISDAFSIVLP